MKEKHATPRSVSENIDRTDCDAHHMEKCPYYSGFTFVSPRSVLGVAVDMVAFTVDRERHYRPRESPAIHALRLVRAMRSVLWRMFRQPFSLQPIMDSSPDTHLP